MRWYQLLVVVILVGSLGLAGCGPKEEGDTAAKPEVKTEEKPADDMPVPPAGANPGAEKPAEQGKNPAPEKPADDKGPGTP